MKTHKTTADIPVMIISNYDDARRRAAEAGAVPGFGKAALDADHTIERIAEYLPRRTRARS